MLNEYLNAKLYRRLSIACLGVIATAAAGTVVAQSVPAAGKNGAMTFPNVRVVSAPSSDTANTQFSTAKAGFLAFIDPVTGALVEPTPTEMAAFHSPDSLRVPSIQRLLTSFTTASGGVGIVLDDSFMPFSIVRKNADGSVDEACVSGVDTAKRLVSESATSAAAPSKPISKGALK